MPEPHNTYPLLESIDTPADLRRLPQPKLTQLADELRQVGRLLVGIAPQTQRGRDRRRRQARDGDSHVALGERFAHQHGRRRRSLLHGAAELLGHADHRQPQLVGLGQQLERRCARVVGPGCQR